MKTLYLDIFSGISGDMFIGALLDLGVPFAQLENELQKLDLGGCHVHATRKHKSSIEGVKFDVHLHDHGDEPHHHEGGHGHHHEHGHHHHHDDHHGHTHSRPHSAEPSEKGTLFSDGDVHRSSSERSSHSHEEDHHHHEHQDAHEHEHEHGRTFRQIREMISHSTLSPWVKEKSVAVFARIAEAEGKIHGQPAEQVHFHEVGAVDSIVDIVGACVALELLGKPRVLASAVTEGQGMIHCAHGNFPIPAPATVAILAQRGIPIAQCEEPNELVTPTGAAILAEFAQEFGPMRGLAPEKVGYGLGTRDNRTRPNVLRAVLCGSHDQAQANDWLHDNVAVLETNLDDINPEVLGYVIERALATGALDAFHTPIQMKKNRPGVLLSIICQVSEQDRFTEMVLRETSALGVRRSILERRKLKRQIEIVETEFGALEVKVGRLNGQVIQASPEYEWCKRAAEQQGVPLKIVYDAAISALKKSPPK